MGRERGVTVMPAEYRQGDDDLLHMLARAYKSNLCTRDSWGILRDKAVYRDLQRFASVSKGEWR